jgi:hypothetical protein
VFSAYALMAAMSTTSCHVSRTVGEPSYQHQISSHLWFVVIVRAYVKIPREALFHLSPYDGKSVLGVTEDAGGLLSVFRPQHFFLDFHHNESALYPNKSDVCLEQLLSELVGGVSCLPLPRR